MTRVDSGEIVALPRCVAMNSQIQGLNTSGDTVGW
jgi:hypothetical protein